MKVDKRTTRLHRTYQRFEAAFRQDLARWRQAKREGHEYKPAMFPPSLLKEGNPLEIETGCLRWRWEFIESLEEGHHFDLDFLILYFLKLQILEKLAVFDMEAGMKRFQAIRRMPVTDDEVKASSGDSGRDEKKAGEETVLSPEESGLKELGTQNE